MAEMAKLAISEAFMKSAVSVEKNEGPNLDLGSHGVYIFLALI